MEGYCPLASGSKGNSTYLGTHKTKILIDAGISGKATKERLESIGVQLEEIDAILVTHDHADHIIGLKTLAFRYKIPVLANTETAKGIYRSLGKCPEFTLFTTGEKFSFNGIEVHPFSIQHDTVDPVGFTLQIDGIKLGVCTDLGYPTTLVRSHLQSCDYLVLESNHEPSMVHACARPMIYKQRVLGRSGHLSNESCAQLLTEILDEKIKHIHLAHLSEECNAPETALQWTRSAIGKDIPLAVAPQKEIGERVFF